MAAKRAKKDYDKDGKVESSTDEYMGAKDRAIKKARGTKAKKKATGTKAKKKMPIVEADTIGQFIVAVSSKNYALANKYLKAVLESKIQSRIAQALNEPLF